MNLHGIKKIVTHDACADGIASAIILHDALPEAEIVFMQYNTPEHLALPPEPGLLFCDFSPVPDRAQEFVAVGAIVLDHHKYAQPVVAQFGTNGVFADELGVSGAVLAYRHVWCPLKGEARVAADEEQDLGMHWLASMAGVRDTWHQQSTFWFRACEVHEMLLFYPKKLWLDQEPISVTEMAARLRVGAIRVAHARELAATLAKGAYRFTTPGDLRVAAFQGIGHSCSDASDLLDADLIIGWTYFVQADEPIMVLSCRARTDRFDAGAFCKAHGGGGHVKAAGCSVKVHDDDFNPFTFLQRLVGVYERRL